MEYLAAEAKNEVKVLVAPRTEGRRLGKGREIGGWVPAVLWHYLFPLPPILPNSSCSYWPAGGDVMLRPTFY